MDISTQDPMVEELITAALGANVIDEHFAADLRGHDNPEKALGMFNVHAIANGYRPLTLLRQWGMLSDDPM